MIACMGGWCQVRDRCQHYYAYSKTPVERLCPPGECEPVEVKGEQERVETERANELPTT